jgi:hypothetical protein
VKVRNKVNFISGWLLGWVGSAAVIAADPLALFIAPTDDWGRASAFSVGLAVVSAATGTLCFTVFAKPYVAISDSCLVVQNPIKRWLINRSDLILNRDGFPYPYVEVGGRRIWLMSMERSLGSLLIDRNLADQLPSALTATPAAGRGNPPEGIYTASAGQIVLCAVWLCYIGLALILR